MKLHPEDPRLTAYLLGELPADEATAVEHAIAADPALQLAIKDYEDRKAGVTRAEPKRKDEHEHTHGDKCYCPYCDIELDMEATFCDACQSSLEEEH